MKLFLSLLVMGLSILGLYFLLKPEGKPRKRGTRVKPSVKITDPTAPKKLRVPPKEKPAEGDEVEAAVRKFADKFPKQTANVLQAWMKDRK